MMQDYAPETDEKIICGQFTQAWAAERRGDKSRRRVSIFPWDMPEAHPAILHLPEEDAATPAVSGFEPNEDAINAYFDHKIDELRNAVLLARFNRSAAGDLKKLAHDLADEIQQYGTQIDPSIVQEAQSAIEQARVLEIQQQQNLVSFGGIGGRALSAA
ncbi:MAG: hypothetical protein J0L97_05915 [Alphaproteobacteria bacterium]|nr:hypothetical protein [Alphaproteobacteria bacterium]